jgi:ATP-dependent HslUV protease ATP-binding subunit HslU
VFCLQVVDSLSAHIIGQADAKRAIAISLRNRWRRMKLPISAQDEIIPKNILMVGPTGCGKTEIARRLAKLCKAPFVKVEATKFTEVGYHGRDVDTIIKDLMDASLALVKELKIDAFKEEVKPLVEDKILEAITGPGAAEDTMTSFRELLRAGAMEDREIIIDVPVKEKQPSTEFDVAVGGGTAVVDLSDFMQRILPNSRGKHATQRRTVKVKEARAALLEAEIEKKLGSLDLKREAVAYVNYLFYHYLKTDLHGSSPPLQAGGTERYRSD